MDNSRLDRLEARIKAVEGKSTALSSRLDSVELATRKGPQFQAVLSDTLKGSLGVSIEKSSNDTIRIRLI